MIDKLKSLNIINDELKSIYEFDEYTLTELLCKFYSTINDVVDECNLIEQSYNYLLNEGLPLEVQKEITNMYNDGRLEYIINEVVLNQKIDKTEQFFIDNIPIEKKIYEGSAGNTTYWLVTLNRSVLDKYQLKVGVSEYYENNPNNHISDETGTDYENNPKLETARNFAKRKGATLVINGGIWDNEGARGNVIVDGEILSSVNKGWCSLGITNENKLISYEPSVTSQTILNNNVNYCACGFYPIMINGNKYNGSATYSWTSVHPRTCIMQKTDGTIYILVSSGRIENSLFEEIGLSMNDLFSIASDLGCNFAFNLDGGGSSSLVYRNEFLNDKIDGYRRKERKLYQFIYLQKEQNKEIGMYKELYETLEQISNIRNELKELEVRVSSRLPSSSGTLNLKTESNQYSGIATYDDNGISTKLLLNDDLIRYYKYANENEGTPAQILFQADLNGQLQTSKGKIADFYSMSSSVDDLNNITGSGIYWATNQCVNNPLKCSCGVIQIQPTSTAKVQILIPFHYDLTTYPILTRRTTSDGSGFYNWVKVDGTTFS